MFKSNLLRIINASVITIILISCASSPEEQRLKFIYSELNKTFDQFEKVLKSSNNNSDLKMHRLTALTLKASELVDEFQIAYFDALSELPANKLQDYQMKFEAAIDRFAKLVNSINN